MTVSNHFRKKHIFCAAILLASAISFTGCTPEEKTMLLPIAQSSEEESEGADPARDFTVKKIYTYSYETSELLLKSAYLKDCSENEIRITALDEKQDKGPFVHRQIDYRYGFYDTLGEFPSFWDEWNNPSKDQNLSELCIDSLLPSPDGKQLLVYLQSALWDSRMVWLQTLGSDQPWLLYQGAPEQNRPMIGSFSPTGHWVTFDTLGSSTGDDFLVPIYDCRKTEFVTEDQYLELRRDSKISSASGRLYSRLYPPDQTLFARSDMNSEQPWTAALYDTSENPGLLIFYREKDKNLLSFEMQYKPPSDADKGLSTETQNKEYPDSTSIAYLSSYLFNYDGISYLQYKQANAETDFYYMGNLFQLVHVKPDQSGAPTEEPLIFSDLVWDFLPLDTGDILVLLVQEVGIAGNDYVDDPPESRENAAANTGNYVNAKYANTGTSHPLFIQNYWDILSADLYLYPAGGTQGQLLYKNVQNFLGMEYDSKTRRILLETYESGNLSHRKCIILEL